MLVKAWPVACSMALRMAGGGAVHGELADALCAEGSVDAGDLFEVDVDGGQVHAGGHDVVGHLVVGEAALLVDTFFVEGVADALGDAAFNLAGREDGVEDLADFLQGVEVGDGSGVGGGVDGDLGDVDGPGVGGVGVALVLVVVPEDGCLGRELVAGGGLCRFGAGLGR